METKCAQSIKVLASKTDINANVGIVESLEYFQDNMCEYFKNLDCDGVKLVPARHAFWAVTKTKMKVFHQLKWLDVFNIATDICKLSKIRLDLSHEIKKDNVAMMTCLQEICLMDSETRRLKSITDVPEFPKSPKMSDNFSKLEFDRFDFDTSDFVLIKNVTIESLNVDYFGHTNNVEYAKIILSTFDCEFFKNNVITDFEIHYLKECLEKDNVQILSKKIGYQYYFIIKKDDDILVKAKFDYMNKSDIEKYDCVINI